MVAISEEEKQDYKSMVPYVLVSMAIIAGLAFAIRMTVGRDWED